MDVVNEGGNQRRAAYKVAQLALNNENKARKLTLTRFDNICLYGNSLLVSK